jgi:hypothetical protein
VIWGFHLLDAPDGTTRLVERGRNAIGRGWLEKLAAGPWLLEPIAFVMSRKMLRTVKRLAESGGEPVGAAVALRVPRRRSEDVAHHQPQRRGE